MKSWFILKTIQKLFNKLTYFLMTYKPLFSFKNSLTISLMQKNQLMKKNAYKYIELWVFLAAFCQIYGSLYLMCNTILLELSAFRIRQSLTKMIPSCSTVLTLLSEALLIKFRFDFLNLIVFGSAVTDSKPWEKYWSIPKILYGILS